MTETSRADSHDNDDGSCRHGRLSRHASPLPPRGAPLRPAAARARAPRRRRAVHCGHGSAPPTAPRPRAYAGGGPWRTRVANQYVLTYLPSSCTSMRMPSRRFPATLPLSLKSHTYALYPRPRFVLCSEVGIPL